MTTWLYEICVRVASSYRRRAHFHRENLVDGWSDDDPLQASEATPEVQLVKARRSQQLERILDTMPPHYRAVFLMFEIEGLSCERIAESVGSPVGSIYSRLHRARQFFERALHRVGAAHID